MTGVVPGMGATPVDEQSGGPVDGERTVVVGLLGVVTVATRGTGGAGEILLTVNGTSESYLAWSETPLRKGSRVLVVAERGLRTVDVASFDDAGFSMLDGS